MWLLLINCIIITAMAVKKILDFGRANERSEYEITFGINSILFWGVFSLTIGFLGQFNGIYLALGEIAKAKAIDPGIIMEGFRISFNTTLAGFWICLFSAFIWLALRTRSKKILSKT